MKMRAEFMIDLLRAMDLSVTFFGKLLDLAPKYVSSQSAQLSNVLEDDVGMSGR
jgi:hypothetical protein